MNSLAEELYKSIVLKCVYSDVFSKNFTDAMWWAVNYHLGHASMNETYSTVLQFPPTIRPAYRSQEALSTILKEYKSRYIEGSPTAMQDFLDSVQYWCFIQSDNIYVRSIMWAKPTTKVDEWGVWADPVGPRRKALLKRVGVLG